MSEAKHTPGPWHIEVGGHPQDVIICDATGNTVCEPNMDGDDFSELDPDVRNIPFDEAQANARLMAAAPALYEALKAARHLIFVHETSPLAVQVRDALALAQGES